jgi:uncharacterized protein YggT (Ycf19 family)|tara:strand:+ start:1045 stop:1551 length:507 start_codon:yes stop_codon:yes gene_type:complete
MDIAHSLVEFFFSLLYVSLQFLVILVEIRYLINWFLNVNPFFEPFVTLWAWTNPVFNFGRRWYPRVFGLDITPIINYKVLSIIVDVCDDIVSYLAGRNNETGGGPINEEPFGLGVDVLGFPDSEIGESDQYHFTLTQISDGLDLNDGLISDFGRSICDLILPGLHSLI